MDKNAPSILMSLLPILSTVSLMMRDPNASIFQSLPYILPLLIPLILQLPEWSTMQQAFGKIFNSRSRDRLKFLARINLKSWCDEPNSLIRCFSTVLWHWNSLNQTVNCRILVEETAIRHYYYEKEDVVQPIFVDDNQSVFWKKDQPGIQYRMWVERNTDREGNEMKEIFLQIEFLTSREPNAIVEHIQYIKTLAKQIQLEQQQKQRVLVSTAEQDSGEHEAPGPNFMIYEFASTSSFENFFCEEAKLVKSDLEYFLGCKDEYSRLGKPWTYTILNEGPPGVGKTKLVKAIAKHTGYTLIVINLAHIKHTQMLYEAFHTPVLGGETVPHGKRLYYIPEVDTQMFDILKRDTEKQVLTPDLDPNAKKPALEKQLSLGEILNVLDGVPERHGHILVLDTNHLSKLDPALIRPGRVNRILSWKKMSRQSMREYLEHYYKMPLPKSVRLPDGKFSAAEIQSIATQHADWKACINAFQPQTTKQ